jgi:exosome complex RNA-binding protein Csl4
VKRVNNSPIMLSIYGNDTNTLSFLTGAAMIPISWREMQCTKTKTSEYRKCAKPF